MTGAGVVIIPTYNEADNLPPLVRAIRARGLDVLVVDDNSPDGTGQVADSLRQTAALGPVDNGVEVIHRAGKLGLGTAYVEGFKRALAGGYELIFEMDADFSHDPRYLPDFLASAASADLVLGSRYVPGGGTSNWNAIRRLISLGGSLYARAILGLPFRDLTGGFKCFHREVLEALDLDKVRSNGYAFQVELTYRAHQRGFRIVEIPIVFQERRVGDSKMSRQIVVEAMLVVWRLKFSGA
ncbi:MAG: polyprenol monophosphomannose synthase [Chloroflexota bacterium]